MKASTRYCTTCGSAMWKGTTRIMGYDEYTGKPWHETKYSCPNSSFFRLWHSTTTVTNDPGAKRYLGE